MAKNPAEKMAYLAKKNRSDKESLKENSVKRYLRRDKPFNLTKDVNQRPIKYDF